MNLLLLTNNPNRASFRQRIGVHIEQLRANGIDCEVVKLPSGELARRKLFKRASEFDGVFLHKRMLNLFDAFWLRRHSKKIIFNFDDAIMYDTKSPERDSFSRFRLFRRTVKLADLIITGNSYLAEHARKFNPNVEVLPYGLPISDYKKDFIHPKGDDKIRLVWIGSRSTLKYLKGIGPVLEEIGSRFNNVVLKIICDDFFDLQNMKVEKCLWSKERRAIDLATGDIGLAPLPDDRFTRGKCTFKILEYASAGLPVVASPIGAHSDYIRDNITGFLANNNKEWIDKISQLITNPQLREKMAKENLAQAKNFDVGIIGKKLTELIKKCLKDVTS